MEVDNLFDDRQFAVVPARRRGPPGAAVVTF
jgi:hypothetical protein